MRIAVDLDDVLADLIACLLATHREVTGVTLSREEATRWDVFPPEVHDCVRYSGRYAQLEPLPGAREFMQWLKARHMVYIVTYRGEHARDLTLDWLQRYVPDCYDGVRFTGGGKVDACRDLDVDLIVDDSYNQIPAVTRALEIPGILLDTPMNRHIVETDLVRRAMDLADVRRIVCELTSTD